ncbi:MAG: SpaA isopeptide-forming pilin-related protein [Peptostreptococcaceae bacterium]|nr:SpaA isopeptide-forming pilin-related protein [Peptostreptococcaceae bacterium]
MQRDKKLSFVSWWMAVFLILNVFMPTNLAYADDLDPSVMKEVKVELKQEGNVILEGGDIVGNKEFRFDGEFKLKLGPNGDVKMKDTLTFEVTDAFELLGPFELPIFMDRQKPDTKIGTMALKSENGKIVATITFNGDKSNFDTDTNATIQFDAMLKYGGDAFAIPKEGQKVKILDKEFNLVPPPDVLEHKISKKGELVDGKVTSRKIKWTVEVSAIKNGTPFDLKDYIFTDDLDSVKVGSYVPDSFMVNGSATTPTINGDKISYTFPDGVGDKATLTFETNIPSDKFHLPASSVTNKAVLTDPQGNAKDAEAKVDFSVPWISKTGKNNDVPDSAYNPKDRTIEWQITINHLAQPLNNVKVKDVLKDNKDLGPQTFVEAYYNVIDEKGVSGPKFPIKPDSNSVYDLGNIDKKVVLTIITKVPDAKDDYTASELAYENDAIITSDEIKTPIIAKAEKTPIGYNPISKDVGKVNRKDATIEWKISVKERGQNIPNLSVYELFVYDKAALDLTKVQGLPAGFDTTSFPAEYQALGQKYVEGSFNGSGLDVQVYPITLNGQRVADFVQVKGFSNKLSEQFTLKSKIVAPEILLANLNDGNNVKNTAALYSNNKRINQASKEINVPMRLVYKEMLQPTAVASPNPEKEVGAKSTNPAVGFNNKEKAVIYRITVNSDNAHLNERELSNGSKMGDITVTDELPEGWEFIAIKGTEKFLIFDAYENNGLDAGVVDTNPDTVADMDATIDGNKASFVFKKLDKPYVILLKAAPTAEKAKEYFSKNATTTITNNVSLKPQNHVHSAKWKMDTKIVSEVLKKTFNDKPNGILDGTVIWTIDYKPNEIAHPNAKIMDVLPPGLDLPTDDHGELTLKVGNEDFVTAKELLLQPDGTYKEGDEVVLTLGDNILYDKVTRAITFKLPSTDKGYRLNYRTYITGDTGEVHNRAKLCADDIQSVEVVSKFAIDDAHVRAILDRVPHIKIIKLDAANTALKLKDAEFTLFAKDGTTKVRIAKTGQDGIAYMKALPVGEYILRETAAPTGYAAITTQYKVKVEPVPGSINKLVTIDGNQTKELIVKNTKLGADVGKVKITKIVSGSLANQQKEFEFTITFNSFDVYPYTLDGVAGRIKSGDKLKLKHNSVLIISELQDGLNVKIAEDPENYVPKNGKEQSVIVKPKPNAPDETQDVVFENVLNPGGQGAGPNPPGTNPPANNPPQGPNNPVRPPADNPPANNPPGEDTITDNTVPQANPPSDVSNEEKTDEVISDNTVPKAKVPKIKGAPKTGLQVASASFGMLGMGAAAALVLGLSKKKGKK